MKYTADRWDRAGSAMLMDADVLARYDDLIDLSIGDTDIITDRRIIDAAHRGACAGATRYGQPQGDPELLDAIQQAWREDFGQELRRAELMVTASSCLGMSLVMLAALNPGDEVIVFSPYFPIYRQQIELAGGVCVDVPTDAAEGFAIREDALRAAVTPRTRMIVFNNPTNPSGAAYAPEDTEALCRVAREYDLLVVADEIYTRYFYQGVFSPLRLMPGMAERTVTLHSFSKNFMMTGWRVGYAIAPEPLRRAMQYVNDAMIYTTPAPSQRAAIEALRLREEVQRLYITQYRDRVYAVCDRLERMPFVRLSRPRGTFYVFPGIAPSGLDTVAFCRAALEKAHVALSPGVAYGLAGEGHVRIACTAPMETLMAAMDRLDTLAYQL